MPATRWRRWSRAPLAAASFAIARIRARPSRGLVTGLGIAIAIAALLITTGSPIVAGDVTLRRALQDVPVGDRSVSVALSVNHATDDELRAIDIRVRAGLHAPGLGAARAQVEYRALAAPDGTVFRLVGVDGLAETVALRDGHLPQQCTPTRCEVVIAGDTPTVALPSDLGIVIVGHVQLVDSSLVAGQFLPAPDEVVLLGDGVHDVGAIAELDLIGRSIGWVAPIDPAAVRVAQVDDVLAAAARIANEFSEGGPTVDVPRDALVAARARAKTASNRVTLAAAQGVVLLVAFALLAAAGARRQHRRARQMLQQRGASRSAANVFTVVEAVWPVLVGVIVGVPLGLGATAVVARRSHLPAGAIVDTVVTSSAWRVVIGALVLLVATAAIMAAPASTGVAGPRRPWWRPMAIDGIGVGAICVGALAVGRGDATPATLVTDGDPLLATLPILAALTMAWFAIRVVPLLVAAAGRALGHRAPLARASLGEIRRRPIVPLATAGFLAAATTLGVFSLGYRSTLATGAHDQAAFAVPLDVTLSEGPALVRPSSLLPSGGWSALAPSARSTEVLRRGAAVQNGQLTKETVTVLGLDPKLLTSLRGWRDDFGPSPATIARLITATAPAPLGTPIPPDATSLVLLGSGDLDATDITAIVTRRDGTWHELKAPFDPAVPDRLTVALDKADPGGRFVGIRIKQPERAAQLTEHAIGEGNRSVANFTASLTLTAVQAGTASSSTAAGDHALAIDLHSLHSDVADVHDNGAGIDITVELEGGSALVLPAVPAGLQVLAAVVDPSTAATAVNGIVSIDLANGDRRSLRVAGVAARFPGAPSRFAVVDRAVAEPSFDLLQPGYGTANEVWIAVDGKDRAALTHALAAKPFTTLDVDDRIAVEDHLRTDPLAEFTLGLFAVAALIAAALAIGATFLATMTDAADQAALHRALAAEGVAPRSLSRMVRTAAVAIAIAAIALGTIGALVFLRLVTRVIAVTATSSVPVPPLVADLSGVTLALGLVALVAPCVLAASAAARGARRAAEGDLLREFG